MSNTFNTVFLIVSFIGFIIPLFMLFRVHWVFNKRTDVLINTDMSAIDRNALYERLPPFNVMVRRWWIWDVNKFLSNKDGGDGEDATGSH